MRNPFKRSGKSYDRRTPEGEPLEYVGSRSVMGLNKLKILAAIITFVVIIVILSESVVIVQAGHRGVVLYVGAVENRVLGEGLHFIIPFAEQVIQLEVRTLKFQADASAASNDLQEVATVIALNYHIDPSKANTIYQQLGADYASREAKAINLITQQLRRSPGYLQWKAINEWNGQMPYTISGDGSLPFTRSSSQQSQLL